MIKLQKFSILIIILLLLLTLLPEPAQAQWPPFWFSLAPTHQDGTITYNITLSSRVDWPLTNLTLKIPLPEGTRFLKADAQPTTEVGFDGQEITFFTAVFNRSLRNASFVVEVTDPDQTVFSTNVWFSWQGNQPGEYLSQEVSIDLTKQTLTWTRPNRAALQLEAIATADNKVITYAIYPKNVNWRRMWDVKINVALPEGTTFLEAQAPPPFVASFDGREVSFSIVEIEKYTDVGPLTFKVSTAQATAPFLKTHAWATWKNVGWGVGSRVASQEETRTGNLIIQSQRAAQVVADAIGDVPFSNYDVTSLAIQEDESAFNIIFYTAGDVGPVGEPQIYFFSIDQDCRADTGIRRNARRAEYEIKYQHQTGKATFSTWDDEADRWTNSQELRSLVGGRMVAVSLPYTLLEDNRQFCWVSRTRNRTSDFNENPPADWIPDNYELSFTQYQATGPAIEFTAPSNDASEAAIMTTAPTPVPVPTPTVKEAYLIPDGADWHYLKGFGEASYPFTAWQQPDYDPSGWFTGPAGLGYGDEDDATLLDDMRDNYLSVFMRHSFDLPEAATVESLILEIKYDDGFVAYLNGTEVVRRNLGNPGDPVPHNTYATSSHEADRLETIELSDSIDLLQPGQNVLAIQGHNDQEYSSDFSLDPALRWEYLEPSGAPEAAPQSEAVDIAATKNSLIDTLPIYYGNDEPRPAFPISAPTTGISGKLAVPIDNGRAGYNVHIFSMPEGQELARIENARQPNIRVDGQRVLINREGGGAENVYEYSFTDGTQIQVSDAPRDAHPFYDAWGNRVVYGNPELTVGSPVLLRDERGKPVRDENREFITLEARKPFIFVQCSLLPPHQETEPRCRDIAALGVLVPAGQMGEIQGTHPVWTATDMIAYKGCNTWAGSKLCGIYTVPSASTKGFSDGFIPRQLTADTTDIPSDSKGDLIAFTSRRDGNWEAYLMNLDGTGLKNLSNSPASNDGLPTISPDGNWVAFVSDRDGSWAIWVVSVGGNAPEKLFDLPMQMPWGQGDRTWTNERISWGP